MNEIKKVTVIVEDVCGQVRTVILEAEGPEAPPLIEEFSWRCDPVVDVGATEANGWVHRMPSRVATVTLRATGLRVAL